MASKRAIRRKACTGKVRHRDQTAAVSHSARLNRGGEQTHAYTCPHCRGWHVGHYR